MSTAGALFGTLVVTLSIGALGLGPVTLTSGNFQVGSSSVSIPNANNVTFNGPATSLLVFNGSNPVVFNGAGTLATGCCRDHPGRAAGHVQRRHRHGRHRYPRPGERQPDPDRGQHLYRAMQRQRCHRRHQLHLRYPHAQRGQRRHYRLGCHGEPGRYGGPGQQHRGFNNNTRFGATPAAVALNGGTLALLGNATVATTETIGAITLGAGSSAINLTQGAGGNLTLSGTTLTRNAASGEPSISATATLAPSAPPPRLRFHCDPDPRCGAAGHHRPVALCHGQRHRLRDLQCQCHQQHRAVHRHRHGLRQCSRRSVINGAASGANVNLSSNEVVTSAGTTTINALLISGNTILTINPGVTLTVSSGGLLVTAGNTLTIQGGGTLPWVKQSSPPAPCAAVTGTAGRNDADRHQPDAGRHRHCQFPGRQQLLGHHHPGRPHAQPRRRGGHRRRRPDAGERHPDGFAEHHRRLAAAEHHDLHQRQRHPGHHAVPLIFGAGATGSVVMNGTNNSVNVPTGDGFVQRRDQRRGHPDQDRRALVAIVSGTMTGLKFVNAGIIQINSSQSLGTAAASTAAVVASGAGIQALGNGFGGITVPLVLNGNGTDGKGALASWPAASPPPPPTSEPPRATSPWPATAPSAWTPR